MNYYSTTAITPLGTPQLYHSQTVSWP